MRFPVIQMKNTQIMGNIHVCMPLSQLSKKKNVFLGVVPFLEKQEIWDFVK